MKEEEEFEEEFDSESTPDVTTVEKEPDAKRGVDRETRDVARGPSKKGCRASVRPTTVQVLQSPLFITGCLCRGRRLK